MKGKIGSDGALYLERGGELKTQYCPFETPAGSAGPSVCGDWCPLFGEPNVIGPGGVHAAYLGIRCGNSRILQFDDFADERGNE